MGEFDCALLEFYSQHDNLVIFSCYFERKLTPPR